MLGVPSLKFFALLGIFTLGIVAFRAEQTGTQSGTPDGGFAR